MINEHVMIARQLFTSNFCLEDVLVGLNITIPSISKNSLEMLIFLVSNVQIKGRKIHMTAEKAMDGATVCLKGWSLKLTSLVVGFPCMYLQSDILVIPGS